MTNAIKTAMYQGQQVTVNTASFISRPPETRLQHPITYADGRQATAAIEDLEFIKTPQDDRRQRALLKAREEVRHQQQWIDDIDDSGPTYFGELDEAFDAYRNAAFAFFVLYDESHP